MKLYTTIKIVTENKNEDENKNKYYIITVIRQNAHNMKRVKISRTAASKVYMYTFTFLCHVKLFII